MSIDAAIIVTEESPLTTISLSVATSNSAGIDHGERCRANATLYSVDGEKVV